jgi:hypothetical protein
MGPKIQNAVFLDKAVFDNFNLISVIYGGLLVDGIIRKLKACVLGGVNVKCRFCPKPALQVRLI